VTTHVLAVFSFDVLHDTMPSGEQLKVIRAYTDEGTYDLPMLAFDAERLGSALISPA
jgi:hypothetical protein